FAVR
ncbi:putative tail assembly protein, partial [Escherichia coli EC1862]